MHNRYQAIEQVAVDGKASERDVVEITRTLRQVAVITRGELLSLGRTPGSARMLEVPDRIEVGVLRAESQWIIPRRQKKEGAQ